MKIAVIGGGFAGVSAAYHLNKYGAEVDLFEKQKHLGGRWFSINNNKDSQVIDNGTHLISGSYANTFELLTAFNSADFFISEKKLVINFIENGIQYKLDTGILSGKLGQLIGILAINKFSIQEKYLLLKFILFIKKDISQDININTKTLLDIHKQTKNHYKYFWQPLILSVFNTSVDVLPAELFIHTLKIAFFGKEEEAKLYTATEPIQELWNKIDIQLRQKRVNIYLDSPITNINYKRKKPEILLYNGELREYDTVICTLPPWTLKKILGQEILINYLSALEKITYSSIINIRIMTENEITDKVFIALIGTTVQWVFSKGIKQPDGLFHYDLLISDANKYIKLSSSQLINSIKNDLNINFGNIEIVNYYISREKKATINITSELLPLLPKAGFHINNLFFAGDWLSSGLPATIESAVLSGKIAAERISSKL